MQFVKKDANSTLLRITAPVRMLYYKQGLPACQENNKKSRRFVMISYDTTLKNVKIFERYPLN